MLADVCNSWLADKTVNVLMAKKTPLAPKLSRAVSERKRVQFGSVADRSCLGYPFKLARVWWVCAARVQARQVAEAMARVAGAQSVVVQAR